MEYQPELVSIALNIEICTCFSSIGTNNIGALIQIWSHIILFYWKRVPIYGVQSTVSLGNVINYSTLDKILLRSWFYTKQSYTVFYKESYWYITAFNLYSITI